MIIFGGSKALPGAMCGPGPTNYTNETWIYSEACNAWQQVTAKGPSTRSRHAAAYGDGKMWVFGGRFRAKDSVRGDYTLLDDLWMFDVSERTWARVDPEDPTPQARSNSALAWDSKRGLLWLFSGNASAAAFNYSFIDDLWSYDPVDNSWQSHDLTAEAPNPRLWHSLMYDESRDRLVVYGGMDAQSAPATYLSDIYAIDLTTFSGTELHDGADSAPDPRFWGNLAYRPERKDYVAFGGHDATALGNRNDTYRFNPGSNTWTLLHAGDSFNKPANATCDFPPDFANVDSEQPERRHAGTMVWSHACGRALLFGGKSDCGIIDDVWAFSDGEWQLLQAATEGEVCLRWRDDPERCTSLCQ
jgi:N-acetylneuraminic acid mutarotase